MKHAQLSFMLHLSHFPGLEILPHFSQAIILSGEVILQRPPPAAHLDPSWPCFCGEKSLGRWDFFDGSGNHVVKAKLLN